MDNKEFADALNDLANRLEAGDSPSSVAREAREKAAMMRPQNVTVTAEELRGKSWSQLDSLAHRAAAGKAEVKVEGLLRDTLEDAWLELGLSDQEIASDLERCGFRGMNQRHDIELVSDLAYAGRLDDVLDVVLNEDPKPK